MNRIKWLLVAGALVSLSVLSQQRSYAEDSVTSYSVDDRLETLDQKIRVLERKLELDSEVAEEKKKTAVSVQAGKDGFALKSTDGKFVLKFRGIIQEDSRSYLEDQRVPLTNNFLLRRVRPILEGTLTKDYDFNFTPDFAGSALSLLDAYLDYHPIPAFRIRAGKFKAPVGLERLQSISNALFTELAFPTSLVPNRDVGLQIHGDVSRGILNYAVGIFTGTQDGASNDTDTNDSKDVAGRIFLQPFKNIYTDWVRELSFGVAGTYGTRTGALSSYKSSGQNTFLTYLSTVTSSGIQWRVVPQFNYYTGRFGLLGEYVVSSQEVKRGTALNWLSNNAWQVAASFVLTEDQASFKGISPKKPFDIKEGHWGAWEIGARYHELNIDEDAFTNGRFAIISTSPKKASAWTAGINWWLNKFVKTQIDYEETSFIGGASQNRDREKEKVVFTRFQVAY